MNEPFFLSGLFINWYIYEDVKLLNRQMLNRQGIPKCSIGIQIPLSILTYPQVTCPPRQLKLQRHRQLSELDVRFERT
jgi:hypothetical protein